MKIQKNKKKNRNKSNAKRRVNGQEKWINNVTIYAKIVTVIYLLLMIIVFPFYAPYGYVDIGINKYYFFRMTGIVCFSMLVPAVVYLNYKKWKRKEKLQLSVTDKAMLLYGAAVILSFVCSRWKDEALWGTEGWFMGAVSQLMFVIIYFAVSRFGEGEKTWYVIFTAVSFFVFALGLLNRFSVYPLEMEGANPVFISTLGNINWFCSYWMVLFPIGMVLYWLGEGNAIWKKAGLILYVIVGFMTGIVQGSSSGFLAMGTMFFVLFLLSFREGDKLLRWLELMLMLVISALLIKVFKSWFPESLNYPNAIAEKITEYPCIVVSMIVLAACYAGVYYFIKRKGLELKNFIFLRNIIAGIALFLIVSIVSLTIFYTLVPKTAENSQIAQAFVLDSDWGNGRGATWSAGIMAFNSMNLGEKLAGVGPDCFSRYVYMEPEIENFLYNVFGNARLTNSHNEWLTILINMGVCGFLAYVAVFVTAIFRQLKSAGNREIVVISGVCILTYTIHNMVSFQQVICTPIVFILLGMGERILCRNNEK